MIKSLLNLIFLAIPFQLLAEPNSAISDATYKLFSNKLGEDNLFVRQIANNKITPVFAKGILEMITKEQPKTEDSQYWRETIIFLNNDNNLNLHLNNDILSNLYVTRKEQLAIAISYDFQDITNQIVTQLAIGNITTIENLTEEDQNYYNDMLRIAITRNYETAVQKLLALGADPNHEDENQKTPLLLALEKNNPSLVQMLLASGANSNRADQNDYTPLLSALNTSTPSFPIIEMLLANGADSNYNTLEGDTPLLLATAADNIAIIKLLLESGATPNTNNPNIAIENKTTPLHEAAQNGLIEIATLLLNAGADINARNQHNQTPLHLAVDNFDVKMAQFLLKEGASCNSQDEIGNSPLHWAAQKGNRELIQLLKPHANCFLKNGEGLTSFQLLEEATLIE